LSAFLGGPGWNPRPRYAWAGARHPRPHPCCAPLTDLVFRRDLVSRWTALPGRSVMHAQFRDGGFMTPRDVQSTRDALQPRPRLSEDLWRNSFATPSPLRPFGVTHVFKARGGFSSVHHRVVLPVRPFSQVRQRFERPHRAGPSLESGPPSWSSISIFPHMPCFASRFFSGHRLTGCEVPHVFSAVPFRPSLFDALVLPSAGPAPSRFSSSGYSPHVFATRCIVFPGGRPRHYAVTRLRPVFCFIDFDSIASLSPRWRGTTSHEPRFFAPGFSLGQFGG